MSTSEDKCEVFEDKYKDRGKIEYFREVINSTEGRKGKRKPPLEEYIRMSRSKMQKDELFLLRTKSLALRAFRQFSVFCYRAVTQLGFRILRLIELRISPTALVAEVLTLL